MQIFKDQESKARAAAWWKAHWQKVALGAALLLLIGGGWWGNTMRKERDSLQTSIKNEQATAQEAEKKSTEWEQKFLTTQEKLQLAQSASRELTQKLKEARASSSSEEPLVIEGKVQFGPDDKPVMVKKRQSSSNSDSEIQEKAVYEFRLQNERERREETEHLLAEVQASRAEAWSKAEALQLQVHELEQRPGFKAWDLGVDYEVLGQAWGGAAGFYAPLGPVDLGVEAGGAWGPGGAQARVGPRLRF